MIKKYTQDHEWIEQEDVDIYKIGITEHAQKSLGDIVFIDLPRIGEIFKQKDEMCVIESVKAASGVYAPISGEIIEINNDMKIKPEIINENAEDTWIVKMKISDHSRIKNLLSKEKYDEIIASE